MKGEGRAARMSQGGASLPQKDAVQGLGCDGSMLGAPLVPSPTSRLHPLNPCRGSLDKSVEARALVFLGGKGTPGIG